LRNTLYPRIPMSDYAQLLRDILEAAEPMLTQVPKVTFEAKPHPEKWSKKELLGHLIDSAYNNHQRFLRAVDQDDLMFKGYAQDQWVKLNQYQKRGVDEIRQTWLLVNKHLAFLIEQIPVEILNRQTRQHNFHLICMNLLEEKEETSLSYLIWDYLFHLEHHLVQLLPDYERKAGKSWKAFQEG